MNQLQLAVHGTAYGFPGGVGAAAAALNVSPGILKNKVSPACESNRFTLDEAMQLMLVSGDCRILVAMAAELGREVRVLSSEPASLLQELLSEQKRHGDIAGTLAEVIADGRVTPREALNLSALIEDDIEALRRVQLAAKAAADNATPIFRAA